MRCQECGKKLVVQQTINYISDNSIMRRRYCNHCKLVYITTEEVIRIYEIEKEKQNLELFQE